MLKYMTYAHYTVNNIVTSKI